jgi:hypothetical protein
LKIEDGTGGELNGFFAGQGSLTNWPRAIIPASRRSLHTEFTERFIVYFSSPLTFSDWLFDLN